MGYTRSRLSPKLSIGSGMKNKKILDSELEKKYRIVGLERPIK